MRLCNPGGFARFRAGSSSATGRRWGTTRTEARGGIGLEVELTDLLYTGRFEFQYANGEHVTLPVARFDRHRFDSSFRIEREGSGSPGLTRATGPFDEAVPPGNFREFDEITRFLALSSD